MGLQIVDTGANPVKSGTGLPVASAQTVSAANMLANIMTTAMNNNSSFDIRNQMQGYGQAFVVPETINWTASSNTATGAVAKTMYVFNESYYNSSPTDNGSGGGITISYGDGFTGKNYNQLFASARQGTGVKIFGFNIQYTITSTGAGDPAGLLASNLAYNVLNGYGQYLPRPINMAQAQRNTQFQTGLLTFRWEADFNSVFQMSLRLPPGDTVSLSFFTNPNIFGNV